MDDTTKMLQAILNGQNALKQELMSKIDKLDRKLTGRIDNLEVKIDGVEKNLKKVEKNLTARMDKIGMQLAYAEDDTPTREEFDSLAIRVDKLEQTSAVV